ncbi:trithorax group protein osa-like isoform X2 [Drosophila teissieri]|uniref:trithorax group protein osa-like isoform X2 n=1 Tax=Drosophila teissieri TaxID=7243 RepID=UPI001CB9F0BD|nr:trithorax group protein osa-like isoform X2 [Drosophila teissieri]
MRDQQQNPNAYPRNQPNPDERVDGNAQLPVHHYPGDLDDSGGHGTPLLPVVYWPYYYYIPQEQGNDFAPFGNTPGFYRNGCWYNSELGHRPAADPPPDSAPPPYLFLLVQVVFVPGEPQMVVAVQQPQANEIIQQVPPPPPPPAPAPPPQLPLAPPYPIVANDLHREAIYMMPEQQPHYIPAQNPQPQPFYALQTAAAPPIPTAQEFPQHPPPQYLLIQSDPPPAQMQMQMNQGYIQEAEQQPPSQLLTSAPPSQSQPFYALQTASAPPIPTAQEFQQHPPPQYLLIQSDVAPPQMQMQMHQAQQQPPSKHLTSAPPIPTAQEFPQHPPQHPPPQYLLIQSDPPPAQMQMHQGCIQQAEQQPPLKHWTSAPPIPTAQEFPQHPSPEYLLIQSDFAPPQMHLQVDGAHDLPSQLLAPHHPAPHHQAPHQPAPHHPAPHHPAPHHQAPHQPAPHQPAPHHPAPHHQAPHQPAPHQPAPHHPAPHHQAPHQPAPHHPAPHHPAPHHQAPHQPAPHHPAPHHPAPHHQAPHQPAPHHPAPHHPAPHHQAPHQPAPHQPAPHHPAPHHQAPHQPAPHHPAPHHQAPHQPAPHHPAPLTNCESGCIQEAEQQPPLKQSTPQNTAPLTGDPAPPQMHQGCIQEAEQHPPSIQSTPQNTAPLTADPAPPQMHLQVDGAHDLPSQLLAPHHPAPLHPAPHHPAPHHPAPHHPAPHHHAPHHPAPHHPAPHHQAPHHPAPLTNCESGCIQEAEQQPPLKQSTPQNTAPLTGDPAPPQMQMQMHQGCIQEAEQHPSSIQSTPQNTAPLTADPDPPQMHLQVDGAHNLPSQHLAPHHPAPHHQAPHHPAPHHPAPLHPAPHHPAPHHPAPHHPAPHHPVPLHPVPHHPAPHHQAPHHPAPLTNCESGCIQEAEQQPPLKQSTPQNTAPLTGDPAPPQKHLEVDGAHNVPSQHLAPHHPAPHHPAPHHQAPHHPAPHYPAPHHPAPHHPAPLTNCESVSPEPEPKNIQSKIQTTDMLPEATTEAPMVTAHSEPINRAPITNSLPEQVPQCPLTTSASCASADATMLENMCSQMKCLQIAAAQDKNLAIRMPQKSEVFEKQWPALGSRSRNKQAAKKDPVPQKRRCPNSGSAYSVNSHVQQMRTNKSEVPKPPVTHSKHQLPRENRVCALPPRNQPLHGNQGKKERSSQGAPPTSPAPKNKKANIPTPSQEAKKVVSNTVKTPVVKKPEETKREIPMTDSKALGSNMFELLVEPDPLCKEEDNEDDSDGDTSEQEEPKAEDVGPPKSTSSKKEKRRLKKQNTALKKQRQCKKLAEKEAQRAKMRVSTPKPGASSPGEQNAKVPEKRNLFEHKHKPHRIRNHDQVQTSEPTLRLRIHGSDAAPSQVAKQKRNPQPQPQPPPAKKVASGVVAKDDTKPNPNRDKIVKPQRNADEVAASASESGYGSAIYEHNIWEFSLSPGADISLPLLHLHAGDESKGLYPNCGALYELFCIPPGEPGQYHRYRSEYSRKQRIDWVNYRYRPFPSQRQLKRCHIIKTWL